MLAHVSEAEYQAYGRFVESVPFMVLQARHAAENTANSYRDFRVGAAVYAESAEGISSILVAGNQKPGEHNTPKCAEPLALKAARKAGNILARGIVVAGTLDPTEISDVNHVPARTLQCCQPCISFMQDSPLARPETVLVTVGRDSPVYQAQSLEGLTSMYQGEPEAFADSPIAYGLEGDLWDSKNDYYDARVADQLELRPEDRQPPHILAQLAIMHTPPKYR